MLYTIKTGGETWKQRALSVEHAALLAFKRRPPKRPGQLTEIRALKSASYYMSTISLLKRAGYSVPSESEEAKHE